MWQLFAVVLLLLSLQMFDYYSNMQSQLPNAFAITGAAVSESQTSPCAETSPCKFPTNWKCQSNSKCYDYSDCLFQCPSAAELEKKEEPKTSETCSCVEWETSGGCGEGGCPSDKVPQSKSCTGGSSCKTENRCVESAQCKADQLPSQRCVDYSCIEDFPELQYCSSKCTIDGKRYESSECEQKCAEAAKATLPRGIDLVPRAEIKPLTVSSLEQVGAGDEVEINVHLRNLGAKSTTEHAIEKQQLSYTVKITIEKTSADGKTATPVATAYKAVSMVDKDIPPQAEAKVMSFVWKPATEGSYRVKIAVDINKEVTEIGEAGESNNEKIYELVVKPASIRLPNLVPTEAEPVPKVEALPTDIYSVSVAVKNTGEKAAVAEGQFLETKVSVLKGDTEICTGNRRDLTSIGPGKSEKFSVSFMPLPGQTKCGLSDKNANYWIVAEVDTIELLAADGKKTKGVVAESNEEDNKQTFQIKEQQIKEQPACSPIGSREAGKYCDISVTKWKDQKSPSEQCSHNFECQTEMCIKGRCVSSENATRILSILGYS